jgi:nicotinamide riboside kinase
MLLTKSVFLVGASSTGKTTLCRALAQETSMHLVVEIARTVMKEKGFTRNDVATFAMQEAIFDAQVTTQKAALEKHRSIIADRSAIDPIVYAVLNSSSPEDSQFRLSTLMAKISNDHKVLEQYRRSLFVLLLPVPAFVHDDGIRSLDMASEVTEKFREILRILRIPFKEIGQETIRLGSRVDQLLSWLD